MKPGIFAVTFGGGTPDVAFSAARNADYESVQYNMACSGLSPLPEAISAGAADAVRTAAERAGLLVASVSATYNMIHPDVRERERGRRSFEAIAGAARRMGTQLLTLCTGTFDAQDQWRHHPDNASTAAWKRLCEEFSLLLPVASQYDVCVGVEPELGNVVNSARRARDLLDDLKDPRVRIVLDAANLFDISDAGRQCELIDEAVELLGDSIALAHAKDRLPDGRFGTAGAGVLDYKHYLAALKRVGFEGSVVAHSLAANEAESVAAFLRAKMAAAEAES